MCSIENNKQKSIEWKIKNGRIDWQVNQKDNYKTVEITISTHRKINGKIKQLLKKSYLYFVGADRINGETI